MSVKIRLQRRGRSKKPFYHIVIADARAPRDGKFIEKIGTYNPLTSPATVELDIDKSYEWLMKGAAPTDTVRSILKFKGVLFKKHLMRGVRKGAMSEEQATEKWNEWMSEKSEKIRKRIEASQRKIAEANAKAAGTKLIEDKLSSKGDAKKDIPSIVEDKKEEEE